MRSNKDVSSSEDNKKKEEIVRCTNQLESYILSSSTRQGLSSYQYPKMKYRYFPFGLNSFFQHCYTEDEIKTTEKINQEYAQLLSKTSKSYFILNTNSWLYGLITCNAPSLFNSAYADISFTLAGRKSKDETLYPIWSFSDSLARHIANWQSQRFKNQDIRSINDPSMLIFEELKDWFYYILPDSECAPESLEAISARTSYIKNMMYIIPDFGNDKLYLHSLQNSLQEAHSIVSNCIVSKSTPQLLSDIIISGKTLEQLIGSYLHFLLINEEVSDNFSSDFLTDGKYDCHLSPVCRIFKSIEKNAESIFSSLYHIHLINTEPSKKVFSVTTNTELISSIKFANFVSESEKSIYLKSISLLDSLLKVRFTLEELQNLQTNLGSYAFALNFVSKLNILSENYIKLIEKSRETLDKLIQIADQGLIQTLRNTINKNKNGYFSKNMRSLETKLASGTTLSKQLNQYCTLLSTSIVKYQTETKKIIDQIYSGQASHTMKQSIQHINSKLSHLNILISAVLDNKMVEIENDDQNPELTEDISHFQRINDQAYLSNQEEVLLQCLPFIDTHSRHCYDFASWDDAPTYDAITHKPIFTFRVYQNNQEVGCVEFYAQPGFCISNDGINNNILSIKGILLSEEIVPSSLNNYPKCQFLPPSLFDKVMHAGNVAAMSGIIRGTSRAINRKLQSSDYSILNCAVATQAYFALSYFSYRVANHYLLADHDEANPNTLLNSIAIAAVDTGSILVSSWIFSGISSVLSSVKKKLENNHWTKAAYLIDGLSKVSSLGFFFHQSYHYGVIPTSTSVVVGSLADNLSFDLSQKLLK